MKVNRKKIKQATEKPHNNGKFYVIQPGNGTCNTTCNSNNNVFDSQKMI